MNNLELINAIRNAINKRIGEVIDHNRRSGIINKDQTSSMRGQLSAYQDVSELLANLHNKLENENEKPECNLDVTKLTDKELSFLKAGLFELPHPDDDNDADILLKLYDVLDKEKDRRWEIRRN